MKMRLTVLIRRACTFDLWSHGAFCLSVCHAVIITGNCVVTVLVGVVGLYKVPPQIIATTPTLHATAA